MAGNFSCHYYFFGNYSLTLGCESIYGASKVQNLPLHFNGKTKIAYERGNFVRYAVTESVAYLGVCEHLRRK